MNKKRKSGDMLKFAVVTFLPILFVMGPILSGFLLPALISFVEPEYGVGEGLGMLAFGLGIIVYFVFILRKCFDEYIVETKFVNRLIVMLVGWIFLLYPTVFVLSNAIGGVSMAVVDGVAGTYMSRLPQYLLYSLYGTFWGSIVFIPWLIIANWIISKFFSSIFRDIEQ